MLTLMGASYSSLILTTNKHKQTKTNQTTNTKHKDPNQPNKHKNPSPGNLSLLFWEHHRIDINPCSLFYKVQILYKSAPCTELHPQEGSAPAYGNYV